MRVLQYNWVFPPHPFAGGRANVCRYYSKFLAMRGHEVTVFTTKCEEAPVHAEENNFKIIRKGFCYSGNRVMDYGKKTLQQFVDYLWLKNHLKEFNVLHLHAPTYGITLLPFRKYRYKTFKGWIEAVERTNTPTIVHFHGMINENDIGLIMNYLNDVRAADFLITVCHETELKLRRLGVKKEIIVIPNGIDLELFNPRKYPKKVKKEFVVLYASGKNEAKGFSYLMEAERKLEKEIPNSKVILLGAGFKKVLYQQMPKYVSQADVVVLPSLGEGFGLSLIEGMAMKKPVIGTNIGGIKEIIKNGENGFLIPPADANSLASAILKLYKDRELRKRMGLKGRKLVEEKFDIRKIILEIEQIYDKVVAR
jgi:glycosyltransferase involved in cell wall biosynthesis